MPGTQLTGLPSTRGTYDNSSKQNNTKYRRQIEIRNFVFQIIDKSKG